ncbi:putative glycosyltransferase [Azoarcus olearius]|uniref:glycosyltransferase family 4 protein n=1 Tax=Azoarcus sp. (strain BH72) TaxID=418699 RepID=UPI0008061E81|nr:glycosyltransferase family 4 protein [Azoarcus olearius]ANQ85401.1 putative glycosyltransferase [Azoarcus olearius]
MKVVHVVRQFHPSIGGMEEVVLNIARHQVEVCGQQAEVVTLNRMFRDEDVLLPSEDEHQGITVRRLPYTGSSRYPLCPSVIGAIRGADVVHVHGVDFFFDYLAATRLLHGKPMIASTHGGFFHTAFASRAKQLWFRTITRASAHAYRRVIATSDNDGEIFSRVVSPLRLRVIENGVDVDKFAGAGSEVPGKTLIYFGRWSVNKGLMETLDLFAQLVEADDQWRLIIAGREFDLSLVDLECAIALRGLDGLVELVAAPSQAALQALLGRAQYFVCLSRHEGFGIAPIEAMSAGLVPVLSAIPPFAKLQAESGIGLLMGEGVGVDDVLALADVTPGDYQARRQRAINYAARYHWRHAAHQYVDEYRNVVGRAS